MAHPLPIAASMDHPCEMQENVTIVCGSKMGDGDEGGSGEKGVSHCKALGNACGVCGHIFHLIDCVLNPFGWLMHQIVHCVCDPVIGKQQTAALLYILDFCIAPEELAADAAAAGGQA